MDNATNREEAPIVAAGNRARARLQSVRRTVQVGDLRMSLLDWMGPDEPLNPPVVLLHGALQTAEGMANLASHLARRGRVIAPDLRGRGETDHPPDGYEPATIAADVAGLVALLGIERPVVIGRLHGGLVGYHLAASHPNSLSGLILGDTPPEITDGHATRLIEATRSLPRSFSTLEDAQAFYQHQLGLPLERALHDIPYDLRRTRAGYTWRYDLDLIARIEEAALPRSDWHLLERIEVPTLVLRGQRGMLSPEMAARMRDAIGDCAVQTILSSGRDVFLGGGAEQAFAAIDLFLLRLSDTGLPHSVPQREGMHAQSLVEPLVRALNGRDRAAIRRLFADDATIELIRDGRAVQTGDMTLADALVAELFEQEPVAVFAVDRYLATRGEAAVALVGHHTPTDGQRGDRRRETLHLGIWIDVDDELIRAARIQVSRTPA